jgi:hypothetical protein
MTFQAVLYMCKFRSILTPHFRFNLTPVFRLEKTGMTPYFVAYIFVEG